MVMMWLPSPRESQFSGGATAGQGILARLAPLGSFIESASEQIGQEVLALCAREGFSLSGIASAAPTRWAGELRAWLDAGKHGSMAYLAEHLEARLDPKLVLPGAK